MMSFRPPSGSKNPQRRTTPQTKKPLNFLNATTSSASKAVTPKANPTQLQNSTVRQLERTYCLNPVTPAVDWEQECDDAYNDYLQALLKRQILEKNKAKVKEVLSSQLSFQSEQLYKDKLEVQRLEIEEETEKENVRIVELIKQLKEELDHFKQMCVKLEIEKSLDNVIELLSEAENRVMLENVLPLQTQEHYDRLAVQLGSINVQLEKILKNSTEEGKLDELARQIENILRLKEEVANKEINLKELHYKMGFDILKTISDHFAAIRAED